MCHNAADGGVEEDEVLEGLHLGLFRYGLGVVRDGSFDRVAHYDQDFCGGIHVLHPAPMNGSLCGFIPFNLSYDSHHTG
ncbi:hypothetical protein Zmor_019936 [Zophobas morio]|uniref:Uncharacterized protein n=1 Tax=Zophobas morio TaxID=2755281 RepID=A0AA38I4I9_9CUCU|nr:hypothetical protein Zmor_019936 [Zophobas morio]